MPKKRWLLEHEATHARRLGLQGALAASGRTGARRAKR
jgi:hypothetical protein